MDQPPSLDTTYGVAFISVIIAAVLYGVTCAQVFYYFQNYSKKDGFGLKAVVVVSLICDTIHQALISHAIYTTLITYYFQPQELGTLIWSPVIAVIFSAIVALLVQSFYAVRIWRFSQRNMIITATLAIFIVGQFVSSIVYVAKAISITTYAGLTELAPLSITMDALAVACDVLITIVFCTLLHRARTNLQRSNTMINLLIVFSVQTGMLTSLFAVAALVSIVASPNTFIYVFFYFLLCRLYCNSLLTALNIRDTIRERGHAGLGISLSPIGESNSLSVANREEIDIKAEMAGVRGYITGVKSYDKDGTSPLGSSVARTNSP